MVYGYNADNLAQALAFMNNAYKRSTLTGNLAVAFANGSYTALSAEEIHQQVKTEMQQQEAAELSLKIIIWFGVGVLILVLPLLVFHIRRRK